MVEQDRIMMITTPAMWVYLEVDHTFDGEIPALCVLVADRVLPRLASF